MTMAVGHSFLPGAAVAFLLFGLMLGTLFVGELVAALLVAFTLQAHHRKFGAEVFVTGAGGSAGRAA